MRLMEEKISYERSKKGMNGKNNQVGKIIVKEGVIVGRGVKELGGRKNEEKKDLDEVGEEERGEKEYVKMEK